jgi:putative PIN family toxin of toxin-antitoxin system
LTRAVIDPNVLVSAFISQRGGSPDRIVRAWREGAFELVVSPHLIAELTDVLGRPKFSRQAAEGRAQAYVAAFARDAILLGDPPDPEPVSPDSDDDYLIALARAAGADAIVSGDPHLTQLTDPSPPVLTPRQFADRLAFHCTPTKSAPT